MIEFVLQLPIEGTLGASLGNDVVLLETGPVNTAALEALKNAREPFCCALASDHRHDRCRVTHRKFYSGITLVRTETPGQGHTRKRRGAGGDSPLAVGGYRWRLRHGVFCFPDRSARGRKSRRTSRYF